MGVTLKAPVVPSSYASIVNPEEDLSVEYIEAPVIDGTKCAKIEQQDVASKIEYWSEAILCGVLGANSPLGVAEGYVRRIWHQYAVDKVVTGRKWMYLVRFGTIIHRDEVLGKGIFYFDRKPFIVKAWNEHLDLYASAIPSLPIWVQFPELDVKYWAVESLSTLGSLLGILLRIDKQTMEKTYLNYARLLLDLPFEGPFPEFVEYINDKGVVTRQQVPFEWYL